MTYQSFKEKYNIRLNLQQDAAVQAVEGNVLLLAVPGSGKTTVLVTRLGYMILALGVDSRSLLAMTYTVAAARDMKSRFISFFGEEAAAGLEFRTINSLAAEIIRSYTGYTGGEAFALLSDEKEGAAILGEIYRSVSGEYAGDSDISALRTAISYAKNMRLKDDELKEQEKEIKGFGEMFSRYKEILVRKQLMDFDDQLVYARSILLRYPDILERYRKRFPYICVDEAQDTSRLQHEIIELLSQGGNLFMVGDEDQSIYGFRAAYPQALLDFEKTYPDAKVLLMEENFRSGGEIVNAADRFIRQNSTRREKHMHAAREAGQKPREISVGSRKAQYEYLLKVAEDCKRETAVLYRDNDCALPLIDLLDRKGIGYRCRQLESSFFTNRVVRDFLDIVAFSKNQTDGYVFMRIYYKLGAGISKALAESALKNSEENQSLLEAVAEDLHSPPWLKKRCRMLMQEIEKLHSESAENAVYRILNYMGYREYLERSGVDTKKCDILQALAVPERNLDSFISRLDTLYEIVKQGSTEKDSSFILSTIHSSKGLEYDRVYLMDVMDGILPGTIKEDDKNGDERLEEERRLFYVAMTRAKNELNVFRFSRRDMPSQFSEFLFKKESQPPVRKTAFTISVPKVRKSSTSWEKKDFFAGVRIKHKSFGEGRVLSRSEDFIQVCFDSGEQKRLMLSTCLKLDLISIIK